MLGDKSDNNGDNLNALPERRLEKEDGQTVSVDVGD